jgi:hypothetical protein
MKNCAIVGETVVTLGANHRVISATVTFDSVLSVVAAKP